MEPLPTSKLEKNQYILVFVDIFTKWVEIIPIKKANETTIESVFYKGIISRSGTPRIIHTDDGTEFVNKTMRELKEKFGIRHSKIPKYYYLQANPKFLNLVRELEPPHSLKRNLEADSKIKFESIDKDRQAVVMGEIEDLEEQFFKLFLEFSKKAQEQWREFNREFKEKFVELKVKVRAEEDERRRKIEEERGKVEGDS